MVALGQKVFESGEDEIILLEAFRLVRLFPMLVISSYGSQGHFCGELMNAAC